MLRRTAANLRKLYGAFRRDGCGPVLSTAFLVVLAPHVAWKSRHKLRDATPVEVAAIQAGTHYQCVECGGVFAKERPDAEAMAEARSIWGDTPNEDMVSVCDACVSSERLHRSG